MRAYAGEFPRTPDAGNWVARNETLPTKNPPPPTTPPPSGRCLLHQVALVPERLVNRQPPWPRQQDHQEPRDEPQFEFGAYPATIRRREQPNVDLHQDDRHDEVDSEQQGGDSREQPNDEQHPAYELHERHQVGHELR